MTGHASKRRAAADKQKQPQWPFPTAAKPAVPWTKKQIRDYAAQQRQQIEPALF